MELTRRDRLDLKIAIKDGIRGTSRRWTNDDLDLLFRAFELDVLTSDATDRDLYERIECMPDDDLQEFREIVCEGKRSPGQISDYEPGSWEPGRVRLFLSHSAAHASFAATVAAELSVLGITCFVAHTSAVPDEDWQHQIESALRSMHALVALTHDPLPKSSWCQQEVGWALGSGIPTFAVRLGAEPGGFLTRRQWPETEPDDASGTASSIHEWMRTRDTLASATATAAVTALSGARSFIEANHVSKFVAQLPKLVESQWDALDKAITENSQVSEAFVSMKRLEQFYRKHGRAWPINDDLTE